jgi:hypothetical protein
MKLLLFPLTFSLFLTAHALKGQDAAPAIANSPNWGTKKVITVGGAQINYVHDTTQSGFREAKFSLMTLAQINQKLFMVSELEVETGDGVTDIGLEQAQLCYSLFPNMTIYGGRFLPKFGKYRGILGEGLLNRMATDPVGFGDGGIGPMVETGIGAVGGFQLGYSKMNYDIYLSNGPQLLSGSADDPASAGQFEYESYFDNNRNKAIGGRIGFLPLTNSSLEVGVSGLNESKAADLHSPWDSSGVGVTFYAIDLNYYYSLDFIKSTLRLMGEYKGANVDKASYPVYGDTMSATYSFNNSSSAYYVQATLRPSKSENAFFKNLELSARYSEFAPAKDALWGGNKISQRTLGLDYWLSWDCVLKLTFQNQSDFGNSYQAQLVYRF